MELKVKPSFSDAPVSFIDLFASFASLLRYNLPESAAIDSRNALPMLIGKAKNSGYNEVLIQDNDGTIAIREGKWKFIPIKNSDPASHEELYDLSKDISEKQNVADRNPKLVREFNERIIELKSGTGSRK